MCGSVSIFVLNKIEVSPHDEVGGNRDSYFERCDLFSALGKASRAKVNVEGAEAVGAVFSIEGDAKGIPTKGIREGDDLVMVEGTYCR